MCIIDGAEVTSLLSEASTDGSVKLKNRFIVAPTVLFQLTSSVLLCCPSSSQQGNPHYADDIGKMCFNGAKSWQIGWYNDRKVMLNPKTALAGNANWGTMVTLVGVADYQNIANIPVVLKLETDTVDDYFVAFNRATGINSDNKEADDQVTVVLTGKNGESAAQSRLKATLAVGEQYVISNFGGGGRDCPIKLVSIDKSTSVWKANVQVGSPSVSFVSSHFLSLGQHHVLPFFSLSICVCQYPY